MGENVEQLIADNQFIGAELMKAKYRIAQLENAIRQALPLETFWKDYGLAGEVAKAKPLSSILEVQ